MSSRWMGLAAVGAGGALGAMLRYGAARLIQGEAAFPRGTLAVNLSGCLLFGLVSGALAPRLDETSRLFVMTGILGGYTTFSAFGGDTLDLLRDQPSRALAYVALSVVGGLAAAALGDWMGVALRR